jgi:hypothetical protein
MVSQVISAKKYTRTTMIIRPAAYAQTSYVQTGCAPLRSQRPCVHS